MKQATAFSVENFHRAFRAFGKEAVVGGEASVTAVWQAVHFQESIWRAFRGHNNRAITVYFCTLPFASLLFSHCSLLLSACSLPGYPCSYHCAVKLFSPVGAPLRWFQSALWSDERHIIFRRGSTAKSSLKQTNKQFECSENVTCPLIL